jgi:hypothetical protein
VSVHIVIRILAAARFDALAAPTPPLSCANKNSQPVRSEIRATPRPIQYRLLASVRHPP